MEKNKNQSNFKAKNKEIDLDKYYKTAGSPSVKSLNFGLWLVTRRRLFIKGLIIALILISAVFFIYSGYNYAVYLINGQTADNNLFQAVIGNSVGSNKNLVTDLVVDVPQVFKDKDSYDLAVKIKNPNDKFTARFNYCFSQGGEEKVCQGGFIFPGEEKYLLALGQHLSSSDNISFSFKNISWQRLNTHIYPDWNNFYARHLNFPVTEIKLNESDNAGDNSNTLEFTLTNQTPYDFWAVPFNILIFSGNNLVGVNTYTAKELKSYEVRSIKLSWSGYLGQARPVLIVPNLDIVASDIYFKP